MRTLIGLTLLVPLFPIVVGAASPDISEATNTVGLELFRQLASENPAGNQAISPYSIESALALAYVGAAGDTRAEMSRALRLPDDDPAVRRGFATMRSDLDRMVARSERYAKAQSRYDATPAVGIEWHAANRLFAQSGFAFRPAFLDAMETGYQAPLEALDFARAPDPARLSINRWVGEQTREKIRNLIPAGGLNNDTRLVLVNALYLKAPWSAPFEPALTAPRPFHASPETTHDVPTMRREGSFAYARESDFAVVGLPYLGDELQCLILLPDPESSVNALLRRITPQDFVRWSHLGHQRATLYLPKFRLEGATVPLKNALERLGLHTAFDDPRGSANFDGIAPRKPDGYLAISNVYHKVFVALDESGTEAAAATAVAFALAAGMRQPPALEIRVDRPFLFAIQQVPSGTCLFLGRVSDPR